MTATRRGSGSYVVNVRHPRSGHGLTAARWRFRRLEVGAQ